MSGDVVSAGAALHLEPDGLSPNFCAVNSSHRLTLERACAVASSPLPKVGDSGIMHARYESGPQTVKLYEGPDWPSASAMMKHQPSQIVAEIDSWCLLIQIDALFL